MVISDTCCVVLFLRIVCTVLPVSLGCPFLIAPSVLSNVYFLDRMSDKRVVCAKDAELPCLSLCTNFDKNAFNSGIGSIRRMPTAVAEKT